MKKAIRKLYSILLVLCMVFTLTPVSVKADVPEGEIIIDTQPVDQLKGEYLGESPGTLRVEAHATNDSMLNYRWWVDTGSYSYNLTSFIDANSLVVGSGFTPGTYEIYCEIQAEGCAAKYSSRTILIMEKVNFAMPESGTVYVKANENTTGNIYQMPNLPVGNMQYIVTGSAISALIPSKPQLYTSTDGYYTWYTSFDTSAQPVGTRETITYVTEDPLGWYKDSVFSLTVVATDKIPVTISGVTQENAVYSGTGQKGYSGTPTAADSGYTGEFNYLYTGVGSINYSSPDMPIDAGDYILTISVPENTGYFGSIDVDFTISKSEVTVNTTAYYISRLGDIPQPMEKDVYYEGFIGGDNKDNCLSVKAVPYITVSDTATPGIYPINFQPQAQLNDRGNKNYTLKHQPAFLEIGQYSNNAEVLQINLPSAVIDSPSGFPTITGSVGYDISSLAVSAIVSEGATWALYRDEALTQEITDKTVSLTEGENVVYLKVISESSYTSRWYKVTITRQSGNTTPIPTVTPEPTSTPKPTSSPVPGTGGGTGTQGNMPAYRVTGSDSSWKEVGKGIENSGTDQVTVEMNNTTVIPGFILEIIAGKDITVTFKLDDKISWRISSGSLKTLTDNKEFKGWKVLDMKAAIGSSNIPSAVMEDFSKQLGQKDKKEIVPLNLNYEGSFGFTAWLSVYVDIAKAGKTANLFYYNPVTKQLEFQYASVIDEKGYAVFPFNHASDYIIVLDDGKLLQAELDKITLSAGTKTLYTGGNTGKETGIRINLPESLKKLNKEDILSPVITYTSGNPKAASVTADGRVKAIKAGKATITVTVTAGGATKTLTTVVTVKTAYIKLTKEKNSFTKGESYTYRAIGYGIIPDKITWSTTKRSVVVIGKKTGKAIAKSKGTDIVIAKYGSIQKKIKVTVK